MNTLILRKIHGMIIQLINKNQYNTHSLPKILSSLTIDISLVDSIYDRLIELEKHQNKQEFIQTLNYSVFLESVKIFRDWKYIDYHVAVDSVRNYLNRELHIFELILISKYCSWFSKNMNNIQITVTKLRIPNGSVGSIGQKHNQRDNQPNGSCNYETQKNSESFMINLWNMISHFFYF